MRFLQRNEPVQTFLPKGSNHAFTEGVRLRTSWWALQHPQPQSLDGFIQLRRENGITIVQQVSYRSAQPTASLSCCRVHCAVGYAVTLQ
jgi:hypothetical protein